MLTVEGKALPLKYGRHHAFFIVEDMDGKWWAGSPANYLSDQQEDDLTTMLEAATIEGLALKIGNRIDNTVPPSLVKAINRPKNIQHPQARQLPQIYDKEWYTVKLDNGRTERHFCDVNDLYKHSLF